MLVKFDSKVGAFSMFERDARQMLSLMGHSGSIPGAILGADVGTVLATFQAALTEAKQTEDQQVPKDDCEEHVPVNRRAWPMLELLKKAAAQKTNIMWDFDNKLV